MDPSGSQKEGMNAQKTSPSQLSRPPDPNPYYQQQQYHHQQQMQYLQQQQQQQRYGYPQPDNLYYNQGSYSNQPHYNQSYNQSGYPQSYNTPGYPSTSSSYSTDNQPNLNRQNLFSTNPSTNLNPSATSTTSPGSIPLVPIDNAKNLLQVFCGRYNKLPIINFFSKGPDHNKTFLCKVVVPLVEVPDIVEEYESKTKKDAEKGACTLAYRELEKRNLLKFVPRVIEEPQEKHQETATIINDEIMSDIRVEDTSKQNLMVYCSKISKELISTFEAYGPVHMREFVATVTIDGTPFMATAKGKTKKEAEKVACAIILKKLSEGGQISFEEESLSRKREIKDFCDRYLNGQTPYIEFRSSGPPHQPTFTAIASLNIGERVLIGKGESQTKKDAERTALSLLYDQLPRRGSSVPPNNSPLSQGSGFQNFPNFSNSPNSPNSPNYSNPTPQSNISEEYYDSPYPINTANTEKWFSVIKFYCTYHNLNPPIITETGNKFEYIVTVTIQSAMNPGDLVVKSKSTNLIAAKSHALGYTYSVLESRHKKLFLLSENMYDKNAEEIMPKLTLTMNQKEELRKIAETKTMPIKEQSIEQKKVIEAPQRTWIKERSDDLLREKNERKAKPTQIFSEAQNLPIHIYKNEILSKIEDNQVLIVSSETGSGKTTQIPQFILDYKIDSGFGATCNILITQPRRISAMTISQRVAAERNEPLGRSVGYKIRFEEIMPVYGGSILFCTTGMLLRMVLSDDIFKRYSHLVIDEVHERNLETDQLLALIKDSLPNYPNLKVILMSATINSDIFYEYFAPYSNKIVIETQSHPISDFFLDQIKPFLINSNLPVEEASHDSDYEEEEETKFITTPDKDPEAIPYTLIQSLIFFICQSTSTDASILVFLPGWEQIQKMFRLMKDDPMNYGFRSGNFNFYTLHSSVSPNEQRNAFLIPPPGMRKIVFATDIAESSITISDIIFVIDSARVKQMRYIPDKNMSSLDTIFTSKANIIQRRGRAGRTLPGTYFCLITYETFTQLPPQNVPEIMRMDLENVCLEVAAMNKKPITEFLESVIEAPSQVQIHAAINRLKAIGALDENQKITPLGKQLSHFPVDPSHARMILHSLLFKCLDPVLTIVASFNTKDVFQTSQDLKKMATEKRLEFSHGLNSDHFATLNVYEKWKEALSTNSQHEFVSKNNLSQIQLQTVNRIKLQLYDTLERTGLIQNLGQRLEPFGGEHYNLNSKNVELLRSLIAPGLSPNFAVRLRKKFYMTPTDRKTVMHPSSVNKKAPQQNASRIYVYQERIKTTRVFLIGTTQVNPLSVLLFCEKITPIDPEYSKILLIDNWIPILVDDETVDILFKARQSMDSFFKYVFADFKNEQTHDLQVIHCLKKLLAETKF